MVLDENGNLILEGGERVRVRVDVVNTGANPVHQASASLTGTPSVVGAISGDHFIDSLHATG